MELKYVAWGLLLTFVLLAVFASNVGNKAKDAWSNMWCLGSDHTEIDDFGMTKKEECVESVGNSTEVGSSICIILLAVGLITYVVKQQQQ